MRTIVIHTSKGGVGKTTLTVNLAYEIARLGNRVLVIDLDEQGNSSLYLGVNEADKLDLAENLDEFNQILESFRNRKEVIDLLNDDIYSSSFDHRQYVYPSEFNKYTKQVKTAKIDVIPSSYRTKETDKLNSGFGGERRLNKVLKKFEGEYDYVLIDTPPNLTLPAKNGLFAARYLIIPTQLEYFSAYSVSAIVREIQRGVHDDMEGLRSRILGIIPMMTGASRGKPSSNKVSKVNDFAKQLLERAQLGTNLFPEIERAESFSIASSKRLPLRVSLEKTRRKSKNELDQLESVTQEIISRIDEDESTRRS